MKKPDHTEYYEKFGSEAMELPYRVALVEYIDYLEEKLTKANETIEYEFDKWTVED